MEDKSRGASLISENEFASTFNGFWESLFPLLSASFIRDFNHREAKRIPQGRGRWVAEVPGKAVQGTADLMAELAFELFRMNYEREPESRAVTVNAEDFKAARELVAKRLVGFKGSGQLPWLEYQKEPPFQVKGLLNVYSRFFSAFYTGVPVTFRPQIRGSGIIQTVEGDACSSNTLIEIKAVNRNLTSLDFRQLLVYLALGLGSGQYAWGEAVFFNPKRAVYYSFNIGSLVSYFAAKSAPEVFDEFIYLLGERETDLIPNF